MLAEEITLVKIGVSQFRFYTVVKTILAGIVLTFDPSLCAIAQQQTHATSSKLTSAATIPAVEPGPVPHPDLSRLEAPIQQQIRSAQSELNALIENKMSASDQLALTYGDLGKLYQAYDFPDAALACFSNAQSLSPEDYRWNYYLASLHQEEGKLDQAMDFLQRTLKKRPDNQAALLRLATIHLDRNSAERAQVLFERVIKINDSSAPALAGLAKIELSRKEFARAIQYLEAALRANPDASSLNYSLGMAYRNLGDAQKAQLHLSKTGPVKPRMPDPLMDEVQGLKKGKLPFWFQGNDAMRAGRFAEAAESYRQMSASDPDDPIARMYLGTALAKMGNSREAIQQFSEALRQAPQNTGLHFNLAIVLLELGSEEESLEHFRAAVGLDPSFKQANFQMANLSMRHGKFADAERAYARVIDQEPSNGFARLMQAMALVRLRQYARAQALLEKGLKALPGDPDLTNALARLLATCPIKSVRNGPRALQLSQTAAQAEKNLDFDLVQTLSMAMAEVGQFDKATQLLRSVISKLEELKRPDLSRLLEDNLRLFEQGKPCRIPWRDDDPIFFPVPGSPTFIAPTQLSPMKNASTKH